MKNKQAFTLVELLAVIVILAIIMAITVPIVINSISSARKGACDENRKTLKRVAELYLVSQNIKIDDGTTKKILLKDLIDSGLINNVRELDGVCDNEKTYIEVINKDGNYEYNVVLSCPYCSAVENEDHNSSAKTCESGKLLLKYDFPKDAYNIKWRISRTGETRDDLTLEWQDYDGGICVDPKDSKNIWIKYSQAGNDIINPPDGQLLVDIDYEPKDYNVKKVEVTITYDKDATEKKYKIGNSDWIDYTGPFIVTDNTKIEAKVSKKISVRDVNGTLLGESTISNYDELRIKNIGEVLTSDQLGPTINVLDPLYEDEKARIQIEYPLNVAELDMKYKINSGEEKNYTGEFAVKECGTEIQAYYYFNGNKSKITTKKISCGTEAFDFDIIMNPDPLLYEDADSSYIRIKADDVVDKIVYTLESKVRDGYNVDGSKKYKIITTGPYEYSDKIFVHLTGKIIVTATDTDTGETITKEREFIFKEKTQIMDPRIVSTSVDDNTKELIQLVYTDENVKRVQYRINGGNLIDYTEPFTIDENNMVISAEVEYNNGAIYGTNYITSKIRGFKEPKIYVSDKNQNEKHTISIEYDKYFSNNIKYSVNGETFKNYTEPFIVYKNGTVISVINIDNKGKEHNVSYVVSGINAQSKPKITSSTSNDDTTEVITIYPDHRSIIKLEYKVNDGKYMPLQIKNSYGTYYSTISSNNNGEKYIFKATYEGGITTEETFTTSKIRGLKAPKIIEYEVDDDNSEIYSLIEIKSDSYLAINTKYSINGGELKDYTGKFKAYDNGDIIYAISTDKNGNTETSSYVLTKVAYVVEPSFSSVVLNDSLIEKVSIKYDERTILKKEYNINGGDFIEYTQPLEINKNNVVITARATYSNGNQKISSYVTSKIRKMRAPTIKTTDSKKELMVEVSLDFDEPLTNKKEYSINGGEFKVYTEPLKIYENNTTVIAKATDVDGNELITSQIITIEPIKNIEISANLSTDLLTFILTADYDTRNLIGIKYSINGGELKDYLEPVEAFKVGSVLYVEATYNNMEQPKTSSYTVSALPRYVPTISPVIIPKYQSNNTKVNYVIEIDKRRIKNVEVLLNGNNVEESCEWKTYSYEKMDPVTANKTYCILDDIYLNGTTVVVNFNQEFGETITANYTENGLRDLEKPKFVSTKDGLGEKICISFDKELGTKYKYNINGGEFVVSSKDEVCLKLYENNSVIYAETTNKYDSSKIASDSYTTTKATKADDIDIIASLSADKHSQIIGINASTTDLESLRYSINGGSLVDYDKPFNVYKNGSVIYAVATYKNGEIKETPMYSTSGIEEILEVKINIKPKTSAQLLEKVTVEINYDKNAKEKIYTLNDGEEINYTGPFELRKNSTIKAIARGDSAYGEDIVMVSNLMSEDLAKPIIKMEKVLVSNGENAKISIEYDQRSLSKLYSINAGEYKEYDGPFIVTENETIISALSLADNYDNQSSQLNVTGLLKYTVISKEGYKLFYPQYPQGAINKKYKITDLGKWKDYDENLGIAIIDSSYEDKLVSNGSVRLKDENDALKDYTNQYFVSSSNENAEQEIKITWDIDPKKIPVRIIGMPDNSVKTDTTYIMIIPPEATLKTEYKINDGEYQLYENALRIIENNTKITARVQYEDGTYSEPNAYLVTNIDRKDDGNDDVIKIYTADDLNSVRHDLTANYILMNDIDLSSSAYALEFKTLGCFSGSFDGNGYKIKNIPISESGLFTCLEKNSEVKNVTFDRMTINNKNGSKVGALAGYINGENVKLDNIRVIGNSTIAGVNYVGGIIGYSDYTLVLNNLNIASNVKVTSTGGILGGLIGEAKEITITNSGVKGKVEYTGSSTYAYYGGLLGHGTTVTIKNSYASGSITGKQYVGGLVGYIETKGTIEGSYASGSVTGNQYVGGLIGQGYTTEITRSYASGNVTGSSTYVGGLIGNASTIKVTKSYASGNVTGRQYVGGLIGSKSNTSSSVTDSYALGNVSGSSYYAGLVGYNYGSVTNGYTIGQVSPLTSGDQLIDSNSGTITNLYFIADTSGRYESNYGTKIDTIYEGTLSKNYTGFDFNTVWSVEENETTPYLQGMMIDNKNYIVNIQKNN